MTKITQVCLLGFGEVGQTLAEDLTTSRLLKNSCFRSIKNEAW